MASIYRVVVAAALCFLGGQAAWAAPLVNTQSLAVDLGYDIYQGTYDSTTQINIWKGIRYAAAPTGDLRWRAPKAPNISRKGTVNATTFGPGCPQAYPKPVPVVPSPSGNEDCLFLNVYAPNVEARKKLPVLVWIHGGGYGAGTGQQDMTEIINANNNSFVAVAIQYRLGAFGFLSSADVEENGVLNAGILDMAFALVWVKNHIGQFGGDASRVTISGQSAGGGGAMLLSTAKNGALGTSLFRGYDYNASVPTQKYREFASRVGCARATDTLSCLRTKDSVTLQTANSEQTQDNFYGNWAFLPVTEPATGFITALPSDALKAKRVSGEYALVGNNADEAAFFLPRTINSTAAVRTWLQGAYPALKSTDIDAILTAYPESNFTNLSNFATTGFGPVTALDTSLFGTGPQQRANNIFAEATFICPSYWLSSAFTGKHRTAYHYQYSVPVAAHGSDMNAYFGPATSNQPPQFTSVFSQIWGGSVQGANPTSAQGLGGLTWPTWVDDGKSKMLNLNTTGGVPSPAAGIDAMQYEEPGIRNDFSIVNALTWESGRGARCDFWKSIAHRVPI